MVLPATQLTIELIPHCADLRRARNLTYVFVSHDLAVVSHMCGRVGVMRSGKLLEETTVEALRAGNVADPYTRRFIEASAGYDRAMARAFADLEDEEDSLCLQGEG